MSFSIDISKFTEKANIKTETVIRKIGLELFSKVVNKTPVDIGRLRGNWFLTFNTPSTEYYEQNTDSSGAGVISKAASKLAGFNKNISFIYLTNNTPYAMRIETTGYSRIKAPQGMARISVIEIAGKYS